MLNFFRRAYKQMFDFSKQSYSVIHTGCWSGAVNSSRGFNSKVSSAFTGSDHTLMLRQSWQLSGKCREWTRELAGWSFTSQDIPELVSWNLFFFLCSSLNWRCSPALQFPSWCAPDVLMTIQPQDQANGRWKPWKMLGMGVRSQHWPLPCTSQLLAGINAAVGVGIGAGGRSVAPGWGMACVEPAVAAYPVT